MRTPIPLRLGYGRRDCVALPATVTTPIKFGGFWRWR